MKVDLSSVIIEEDKIEQIKAAISQLEHFEKIFKHWGFEEVFEKGIAVSLLFYGMPGTGKTLMAEAIANYLNQDLLTIGTADIETSEPGGAERAIQRVFADATEKLEQSKTGMGSPVCLCFDECDSLLTSREDVGVIMAAQINTLLQELERFTGVVMFTTNRLGRLDPALERRITAKIEFAFPTEEQRALIWRRMIPQKAPLHTAVSFEKLSIYEITGGNIKNAVLNAARAAAYRNAEEITMKDFIEAIEDELKGIKQFKESRGTDNYLRGTIHHNREMVRTMGGVQLKKTNTEDFYKKEKEVEK